MKPKQKYDERKRLRAERLLRQEQMAKAGRDKQDNVESAILRSFEALERIADVLELWADQQEAEQ
jgi:hypothetical protein